MQAAGARASYPRAAEQAAVIALLFGVYLAWEQSYYWRKIDEYSFGWLVPVFIAYLLRERWPLVRAHFFGVQAAVASPRKSRFSPKAKPIVPPDAPWFARLQGRMPLLERLARMGAWTGFALFIVGAFFTAAMGSTPEWTLWVTLGTMSVVVSMAFLASGTDASGASVSLSRRVGFLCLFVFPVCIWLVSAPIAEVVERTIRIALLEQVTGAVRWTFEMMQIPIVRDGNRLILANGAEVGVEEACSGIRSLTACIFAGSFLAAISVRGAIRKVCMVLTAMLFAFLMNLVRSWFLTFWSYLHGQGAIDRDFSGNAPWLAGADGLPLVDALGARVPNPEFGISVHDVAGYAVLGVTCVLLICLLPIFNYRLNPDDEDPCSEPDSPQPPESPEH